jgi:hypothetical protein
MATVTVTGNIVDAGETARAGVAVTAELVAASYQLAAGGQVDDVTIATVSEADGDWSLDLVPNGDLQESGGSYYVFRIGLRLFYGIVPASGSVELGDIITVPGPLPASAPVVKVYDDDLDAYVLASGATIFIGGPSDPTSNDGDIWFNTD